MGYSYEPRKFTVGQRERILTEFFRNDRGKKLVQSRGGEPITKTSEIKLKNTTCIPGNFRLFGEPKKTRNIAFGNIKSNVKQQYFLY